MKKLFMIIVTLFAFAGATGAVYAAVNINTATQAELETLQGIGPGKAKAIIDYRKKNGPFKSVDDLEKVDGIGPGTMKQLRKDIAVSGATAVKKDDKPAAKEEKKDTKPAAKEEKKDAKAADKKDEKKEVKKEEKKADVKVDKKDEKKADVKADKKEEKKSDKK